MGVEFPLPFNNREFDIIYLYSIFSHMTTEDVTAYLNEFKRLLAPSGKIFLTAFIEQNVQPMTINPPDYRRNWQGPLHCVRYDKNFFISLLGENGFKIDRFDYEKETDGQSGLYISRDNVNMT